MLIPDYDIFPEKSIFLDVAIPMDMYNQLSGYYKDINIKHMNENIPLVGRNSIMEEGEEESEALLQKDSTVAIGNIYTISTSPTDPFTSNSEEFIRNSSNTTNRGDHYIPNIIVDNTLFPIFTESQDQLNPNPYSDDNTVGSPNDGLSPLNSNSSPVFPMAEEATSCVFTAPSSPFSLVFKSNKAEVKRIDSSQEGAGQFDYQCQSPGMPEVINVVCISTSQTRYIIPVLNTEDSDTICIHYKICDGMWGVYGIIPDSNVVYPCVPFQMHNPNDFDF